MTGEEMISGSGLLSDNLTCDAFYQFVIEAAEAINEAPEDDTRSVHMISSIVSQLDLYMSDNGRGLDCWGYFKKHI